MVITNKDSIFPVMWFKIDIEAELAWQNGCIVYFNKNNKENLIVVGYLPCYY